MVSLLASPRITLLTAEPTIKSAPRPPSTFSKPLKISTRLYPSLVIVLVDKLTFTPVSAHANVNVSIPFPPVSVSTPLPPPMMSFPEVPVMESLNASFPPMTPSKFRIVSLPSPANETVPCQLVDRSSDIPVVIPNNTSTSIPSPPSRMSSPLLPLITSLPSSPITVSLPSPPLKLSAPCPPFMSSLPLAPSTESSPIPPINVSLPL